MVDKTGAVKAYVDNLFEGMASIQERRAAYIHSYGVAECCSLIAVKRRLNPEIAYVCGLLHDVYAYKTGVHPLHSINGAEMVKVAFKYELKDIFTDEEQTIIKSAIFHHSDKEYIHDGYDEILKDADVLQHWLCNQAKAIYVSGRLVNLHKEFGLLHSEFTKSTEIKRKSIGFNRILFGNIAERLAGQKIRGEKTDSDFMGIIKYFPETTAFDELKNAWCAAFVYHCVLSAGLNIPIRYKPTANTRFACVEAWLKWGGENGFCLYEKDGYTPSRGDIIIYNNVIPPENKPANIPWHDHIGIVLSVDGENIIAAEGNVDNKNVSGIVCRKRDEKIGCYVRIPDLYEYDGWKYDYKTEKIRMGKL